MKACATCLDELKSTERAGNGLLNRKAYSRWMNAVRKKLGFGYHVLAVLAAAALGSTILSLTWIARLAIAVGDRSPGLSWFVTLAVLCWLTLFISTLPSAGLVFSLLWPVTRNRTAATGPLCIIAGASVGILLAPLASPKFHGATLTQLSMFAFIGATIGAIYFVFAKNLGRAERL